MDLAVPWTTSPHIRKPALWLPVCRPLLSGIGFEHAARLAAAGPCTGAAAAAPWSFFGNQISGPTGPRRQLVGRHGRGLDSKAGQSAGQALTSEEYP